MSIKGNWRRHGSEVVIRWYQRFFSPRFATRHRGFAAQFCRPQREKNLWHQGIIYSTPARSVLFFSTIACSVLMPLVFYHNDMLRKVTRQRTQQFPGFVCCRKNPVNATHAQLLEKYRPIALAETCRFLTIQSLEFQEIWQKNRSETTWMIYHEKSEFDKGNF